MSQQVTTSCVEWSERIRLVGVGILSGAIAGLVVGIGARINMRIVALTIHQVPVLTLATLFITCQCAIKFCQNRRIFSRKGPCSG